MLDEFHPVHGCDCVQCGFVEIVPQRHFHRKMIEMELVNHGYIHFVPEILNDRDVQDVTWSIRSISGVVY